MPVDGHQNAQWWGILYCDVKRLKGKRNHRRMTSSRDERKEESWHQHTPPPCTIIQSGRHTPEICPHFSIQQPFKTHGGVQARGNLKVQPNFSRWHSRRFTPTPSDGVSSKLMV
ncbi:hypothetical protein KQX54_012035 [Cotesia glomerata]|uniref:Uncharacterized protein n=1 Tax=Cotesia glomerata TaxID=32391 RepID=A0AAV7IS90_COTGL|nr:hypothetical protein KQX54_012035 [Cotesia glomerata]